MRVVSVYSNRDAAVTKFMRTVFDRARAHASFPYGITTASFSPRVLPPPRKVTFFPHSSSSNTSSRAGCASQTPSAANPPPSPAATPKRPQQLKSAGPVRIPPMRRVIVPKLDLRRPQMRRWTHVVDQHPQRIPPIVRHRVAVLQIVPRKHPFQVDKRDFLFIFHPHVQPDLGCGLA